MMQKNGGAAVPNKGAFVEADQALLDAAYGLRDQARGHLELQAFHKALDAIWAVVGAANRYVDEQAPWALKKTDPARMATVLWTLAETVRSLSLVVQPFMPDSCGRMLDQLSIAEDARDFASWGPDHALVPGVALPKPEGVFPRFVEE